MRKIVLPLLAVLFSINLVLAQDIFYIDQHDDILTSNGILYDSGGPDGNYSDGENVSCRIAAVPGYNLTLHFEEFELEDSYDDLTIRDGDSFSDPVLLQASGDDLLGHTITLDEGGVLLFSFVSDGSVNHSGFKILISTVPFVQDFSINWLEQDNLDFNSIINFCEADTLNFKVKPTFYQNHMVYHQTADSLSYEWSVFRNGDSLFSQVGYGLDSLHFPFTQQGLYQVTLVATDQRDNVAINNLEFLFTYGPQPDFTAIEYPDTVCQGSLFEFLIDEQQFAEQFTVGLASNPFDTAYIPDGSGAEYVFSFPVYATNNEVVQTVNDLSAVYINMEHSYMGDLDIWLECPNGQTAMLFEQSCGSAWFGEATDGDDGPNPGIGYDYFWTMSASSLMSDDCPTGGSILPTGDYLPVESFASFIGCPVGGIWKLHILDNLSIDNGYIFDFELLFDINLLNADLIGIYNNLDYLESPDNPTFLWEGNQIVSQSGGNAEVIAEEPGLQNYHLTVENQQGCSYESDYQVFVLSDTASDCCISLYAGADQYICGQQVTLNAQTDADSLYWEIINADGLGEFSDSTAAITDFQVDTSGVYTILCHAFNTAEGCNATDKLILTFVDEPADADFDLAIYENDLMLSLFYTGNASEYVTYNWITPGAENVIGYGQGPVMAYYSEPGIYEVGLSVDNGCLSDTNYISFEFPELPVPLFTITNPTCDGGQDGSILIQHDNIDEIYLGNDLTDTLITGLSAGIYDLSVHFFNGYIHHEQIELVSPEPFYGSVFAQNEEILCGDSLLLEFPGGYDNHLWDDGSSDNPITIYESRQVWVFARDSTMCLHIDSINIVLDNLVVQPILAGYTETGDFLSSWSASENISADSLDLFVWNETLPPLMITKTAIADSAWIGDIDNYTAQYFYVQHENSCQDTLTSDLINVLSLIDGGGKSSELPLYWQVPGYEYFESEISILSDELPFDDFVLYDTHPIDDSPYIMDLPEHSVRIQLRVALLNAITLGGNTYNHLYSDVLFHQAEMLEAFDNSSMYVYPNPFSDELIYGFSESINEPVRVTLTDAVGKVVFSKNHTKIQSGETIRVDTKSLNVGLYVLQIQSESHLDNLKLIKQ
jgi:hypothetical protein